MSKLPLLDLSAPIEVEGYTKKCFYDYLGFRAPRKGEYFLSGAIIEAYRAPCDMTTQCHVIKLTYTAKQVTKYEKGNKILDRPY